MPSRISRLPHFSPSVALILSLLLLTPLMGGCWFTSKTEHYPSSTISGFEGNWFTMRPTAGNKEVFVLRQTAGMLFPPMVGHGYLFLEIEPIALTESANIRVPSSIAKAMICQEIHPGYWCGQGNGEVTVFRVLPDWVDLHINLEAESGAGLHKGYSRSMDKQLAFKRSRISSYPGLEVRPDSQN